MPMHRLFSPVYRTRYTLSDRECGMKLLTKFNLILIALFGAGSMLIAFAAYRFLMRNARTQVVQQAELMIESARSTRQYTSNELAPLLETLPAHQTRFLPETIPFYAATVTFDYLRKQYPDYSYKEAALNPSNLRDRAVDWEADLINYFRNHAGEKELVGERDYSNGTHALHRAARHGRAGLPGMPQPAIGSSARHRPHLWQRQRLWMESRMKRWRRRLSQCPWRCQSK